MLDVHFCTLIQICLVKVSQKRLMCSFQGTSASFEKSKIQTSTVFSAEFYFTFPLLYSVSHPKSAQPHESAARPKSVHNSLRQASPFGHRFVQYAQCAQGNSPMLGQQAFAIRGSSLVPYVHSGGVRHSQQAVGLPACTRWGWTGARPAAGSVLGWSEQLTVCVFSFSFD